MRQPLAARAPMRLSQKVEGLQTTHDPGVRHPRLHACAATRLPVTTRDTWGSAPQATCLRRYAAYGRSTSRPFATTSNGGRRLPSAPSMRLTDRGPPSPPPGSRTAESAFDAVNGARTAESAPGIADRRVRLSPVGDEARNEPGRQLDPRP